MTSVVPRLEKSQRPVAGGEFGGSQYNWNENYIFWEICQLQNILAAKFKNRT